MIRIGYQGINGSYSETASSLLTNDFDEELKFIGLVSSKNVVESLLKNEIDFGVVAVKNTKGGIVLETEEALNNLEIELIDKIDLEIHHCVFKLFDTDTENINYIASHAQALKQTENNIAKYFGNLEKIILEDTAIGAMKLSTGKIPSTSIVVCSKEAGERYNLELLKENIEDEKENITTFILFKIRNV